MRLAKRKNDGKRFLRVIVPTYNGGERFRDTMYDSIRAQTFDDYHLIVVDDVSDDGTRAVLNRLKRIDKRIYLKEKRYAGGARNAAYGTFADDDYTLFLDDDDRLWDESVFQRIHDCAVENGMPDVIRTNWRNHVEGREVQKLGQVVPTLDTVEKICADITRHAPWNRVVRTSKLVEFPEGITTDDGIQAIRQLDVCETAAVIPECCYEWKIRPGSITTSFEKPLQRYSHYLEFAELVRMSEFDAADGGCEHGWARESARRRLKWLTEKSARM